MAEIVCRGLSKRYPDGTVAVRDFDLEIADGEFLVLVGPSGCGKTTVLRMLAGLEAISGGELMIDGVLANDLQPRQRDVAMVFQSYALYPHMSVEKNMGFALRRAGMPKDQVRERVRETANMLGIGELLARKPSQLSGGQRQRVAMGRAIVREPKAFLMDEPLSNLDAKLRVQMRAEITRIQRRLEVTTVYVTHDQTEAMTLGDRIVVMRDGIVQQSGTPEELYARPRNLFVAGFIGAPSMNLLRGRLQGEKLVTALTEIPLDERRRAALAAHDGELIVGIRPEDFEDAQIVGSHRHGHTLSATIDVIEATGSDVYAHISLHGDGGEGTPGSLVPQVLEEEGLTLGTDVVARLSSTTGLREGEPAELWLDTDRLHLFDADSGERLVEGSEPVSAGSPRPAAAAPEALGGGAGSATTRD